jgi:hypothetical protein
MLHLEGPRLFIHATDCEKANTGDVEKEEDERFECHVANAVVRPWAMMIHLVNTPIAFTAMVHA